MEEDTRVSGKKGISMVKGNTETKKEKKEKACGMRGKDRIGYK